MDRPERVRIRDRKELGRAICSASYLEGDFTLRSGRSAKQYFDKYQFESDPELLRRVSEGLVALVPEGVEMLAGLELGGVPVATALSLATSLPVAFVRKVAKTHGTAKIAEGPDVSGRRVLVVEDVVTSGGQLIASIEALTERGAIVTEAVCVIDREEGGRAALARIGVVLSALFTATELSAWIGG